MTQDTHVDPAEYAFSSRAHTLRVTRVDMSGRVPHVELLLRDFKRIRGAKCWQQ